MGSSDAGDQGLSFSAFRHAYGRIAPPPRGQPLPYVPRTAAFYSAAAMSARGARRDSGPAVAAVPPATAHRRRHRRRRARVGSHPAHGARRQSGGGGSAPGPARGPLGRLLAAA